LAATTIANAQAKVALVKMGHSFHKDTASSTTPRQHRSDFGGRAIGIRNDNPSTIYPDETAPP
jgi:hypothetical protein